MLLWKLAGNRSLQEFQLSHSHPRDKWKYICKVILKTNGKNVFYFIANSFETKLVFNAGTKCPFIGFEQ
jgi:hypothetical protein